MINASERALQRLIDGNRRFTGGVISIENLPSINKLKELAEKGQKPFAIILCCADSRTPTELIFDQGLGDLFVLRVAGNVVGPSIIASMEFAATKFETPLIVVMGHTKCGAIQTTIDLVKSNTPAPSKNLERLVSKIKPNVEKCLHKAQGDHALLDESTWNNVYNSKQSILDQSTIITELYKNGKIQIACSVFDLDTGHVEFESRHLNRSNSLIKKSSLEFEHVSQQH